MLADSPYEWSFPVAGAKNVALNAGTEQASIIDSYTLRTANTSSSRTRGPSFPLHRIQRH